MAANPMIVNTDVTITYDGASQRVARGTLIDVPNPSALRTAIGSGNLTSLQSSLQSSDGAVSVGPFMENVVGGGQLPTVWAQ
jgi:hypothetical protein